MKRLSMRVLPSFLMATFALTALSGCQTPPPAAKPAAAGATAQAITPAMARNIANNCFTCHGPDGRSPGTVPSLHLLGAEKIASQLKGFKSGTEPSTVMGRHAKAYTNAEIEAVANYIAGSRK